MLQSELDKKDKELISLSKYKMESLKKIKALETEQQTLNNSLLDFNQRCMDLEKSNQDLVKANKALAIKKTPTPTKDPSGKILDSLKLIEKENETLKNDIQILMT